MPETGHRIFHDEVRLVLRPPRACCRRTQTLLPRLSGCGSSSRAKNADAAFKLSFARRMVTRTLGRVCPMARLVLSGRTSARSGGNHTSHMFDTGTVRAGMRGRSVAVSEDCTLQPSPMKRRNFYMAVTAVHEIGVNSPEASDSSDPFRDAVDVAVPGGMLRVTRAGSSPAEARSVVLALHGMTGTHMAYRTVARELSRNAPEMCLLAPDLRGGGERRASRALRHWCARGRPDRCAGPCRRRASGRDRSLDGLQHRSTACRRASRARGGGGIARWRGCHCCPATSWATVRRGGR